MTVNGQWLLVTLTDAAETLQAAIERIQSDERRARGVLENEIPALYAKLNYAVNTAEIGPDAINTTDHNALIAWPESMPFDAESLAALAPAEGDEADDESEDWGAPEDASAESGDGE